MDDLDIQAASRQSLRPETEVARQARIGRELAIVTRAEAAIDAGLGIEYDNLEKWFDALDKDENTSMPTGHRPAPR